MRVGGREPHRVTATLVLGLLVALVAAGCGGGSSRSAAPTVKPTASAAIASPTPSATRPTSLTLRPVLKIKSGPHYAPYIRATNVHDCHGINGFNDLKKGAGVTIYGPSGRRVVGTGLVTRVHLDRRHGYRCVLYAVVRHVPVLPFYEVQFTNRNKLAFSRSELLSGRRYEVIG